MNRVKQNAAAQHRITVHAPSRRPEEKLLCINNFFGLSPSVLVSTGVTSLTQKAIIDFIMVSRCCFFFLLFNSFSLLKNTKAVN